ncbi:hypothetical protein H6P81_019741 [Aristolochia fimbriata]|uniref:Uncharacterized protein n=1 Tax=Aristolochia fimbriata TaxID=158543 RepID=A0AAV7DVJ2_ARIFI|nr:hypothetical protein H6P81_019741 [Aristolochia fimbriata]
MGGKGHILETPVVAFHPLVQTFSKARLGRALCNAPWSCEIFLGVSGNGDRSSRRRSFLWRCPDRVREIDF